MIDVCVRRIATERYITSSAGEREKSNTMLISGLTTIAIFAAAVAVPLEARQTNCLGSNETDETINKRLFDGGENTVLEFCENAVIRLKDSVYFTAKNQIIRTRNRPTGGTRARFIVTGAKQSVAFVSICDRCSGVMLSHVNIIGSRTELGRLADGYGLVEFGGATTGQRIQFTKFSDPRGWTAVHLIEGYDNSCNNAVITNNEIALAGRSPTNGLSRLAKRAQPGEWADGISVACKSVTVTNNLVNDATDGGIVLFGAPGTQVKGNTIRATTQVLMGGINMVDFYPYNGDFTGVVVSDNTLHTAGSMIKVGIALGGMTWGSDNRTAFQTQGGFVTKNTFRSSDSYFGYAVSVAGHQRANVQNNYIGAAKFGGSPSPLCIPHLMPPPPQAYVYDPWTTPKRGLPSVFEPYTLAFLICMDPSGLARRGTSTTAEEPTNMDVHYAKTTPTFNYAAMRNPYEKAAERS